MNQNPQQNTLTLGQQAFAAFKKAVETGDSNDFVEMTAQDVRFTAPFPFDEWRGEQRGRERAGEMFKFERDEMQNRVILTQTSVMANENTAGVEFDVAGTNKGGEYKNHNAIFFDFENEQIKAFREYCGDVDPKAVAAVNAQS